MTKISVLIVAYNDSKLLLQNLPGIRKIMEQSGYSYEIVGVDNGSSDDSDEILCRYCDRVLRLEKNRFYVPALNKGFDACRGDFILLTCPDMTWESSVLRLIEYSVSHNDRLVAPTYHNPDGSPQHILHNRHLGLSQVFFATPLGEFLDHHVARYGIRRSNHYAEFEADKPFLVDWTGGMFVIPAKVLRSVGGSDERMPLSYHDADFCDRLDALGVKRVVVPDAKVYHVWAGTTSKDPRTSYQASKDFRAYVGKWWRFKQLFLWPLVFFAIVFSVPIHVLVQRTLPKASLLALRVG